MDYDYSPYLGKDYKEQIKPIKKVSSIIANHVSWIDSMNLYQYYQMAFSLDIGFKKAPLMSNLGDVVDSIYLPIGGSDEKRMAALNAIKDR